MTGILPDYPESVWKLRLFSIFWKSVYRAGLLSIKTAILYFCKNVLRYMNIPIVYIMRIFMRIFKISVKLLAFSRYADYNLPRKKTQEENMKKILFAFALSIALLLSFAACGSAAGTEDKTTAAGQQTSENAVPSADDGQNPVMNFVGIYSTDHSMEALVEADGEQNAKITLTYAGSPWFHHKTVMSGLFDPDTLTVEFNNSEMTEYTYKSDGSIDEEKTTYIDSSGRAVFSYEDNTLTITDCYPSGEIETVYVWGPSPDMKTVTDPDRYASVTAMDKRQVETVVGFNVRTAYLSENWYAMAEMIRYPITINGTELADADAFLGYMIDKTISESDRNAMMEEDFLDMFVNYQGIMMGNGEIWLSDPTYGTNAEPVLEIIAINGIVER